jgi:hypothetical protein
VSEKVTTREAIASKNEPGANNEMIGNYMSGFLLALLVNSNGKRANHSHLMLKSAIQTIGFGQGASPNEPKKIKIYIFEIWTHERSPFEVTPELKMT